jgi:hypothetical protein
MPIVSNCATYITIKGFYPFLKRWSKTVRYIGECTRLAYDLIDKLEEDDIPGLLLLIDFEKAFDTVEIATLKSSKTRINK